LLGENRKYFFSRRETQNYLIMLRDVAPDKGSRKIGFQIMPAVELRACIFFACKRNFSLTKNFIMLHLLQIEGSSLKKN